METINVHLYRTEIPAFTSLTPAPSTVPEAWHTTSRHSNMLLNEYYFCPSSGQLNTERGPDPKAGSQLWVSFSLCDQGQVAVPQVSVFSMKERARPGSLRSFLALKFVVYPQKLVTRSCGMNSTDLFLKK